MKLLAKWVCQWKTGNLLDWPWTWLKNNDTFVISSFRWTDLEFIANCFLRWNTHIGWTLDKWKITRHIIGCFLRFFIGDINRMSRSIGSKKNRIRSWFFSRISTYVEPTLLSNCKWPIWEKEKLRNLLWENIRSYRWSTIGFSTKIICLCKTCIRIIDRHLSLKFIIFNLWIKC